MTEQEKIEKFYSKYFYFSHSSLSKLLFMPSSFYNHYLLNNKEEKLDSYLVEGRVIHCLILEEINFNKMFSISPNKTPNGNTKKLIHSIYELWKIEQKRDNLEDYPDEILNWLNNNNLHQKLKEDSKRLEKILTNNNIKYFEYLVNSKNKTVIDQETYDKCRYVVEKLKEDNDIYNLINPTSTSFDQIEIKNEILLKMKLKDFPFGLKGIIDNLTINHEKKEILINDLKTTGKTLNEFKDTVEFFKYWQQAAIYYKLVYEEFKNLKGYSIKFNFIVIDKYTQFYVFKVSNKSMSIWQKRLLENLKIGEYHYKNIDYKLPYEFATKRVVL